MNKDFRNTLTEEQK